MTAVPIFYYPYVKRHYADANTNEWIVFDLFFLGGALFFGVSLTGDHFFSYHSCVFHDVYHRLDLLGVSTVMAGCFSLGMRYTFPCSA